MRKLMGGVVLAAGVGGLGWYGSGNNAETMQAEVTQRAADVASTSTYGITTDVSGRDIVASGLVQDQAEFDTLQTSLNAVEGRRIVDMSGITILPLADPFEMAATRTSGGMSTLTGVIGSETGRAAINAQAGDLADELVLSAGRPDENWATVGANGLAGLALLEAGEMTLSGRDLTLTGLAASPVERTAALAAIGDLPDGYTLSDTIDVADDGTPLRLMLDRADGSVSGTGKVPAALTSGAVQDAFDMAGQIDLVEAGPIMDNTPWDGFALQGMAALDVIDTGTLRIEDTMLTLTGTATPDGIAAAEAALATVPDGYTATTDLTFVDDGEPFSLAMEFDGSAVTSDGKYPADFAPDSPNAAGLTDAGRNSFFSDDSAFTENAEVGISALGLLENGTLFVSADEIIVTGLAASLDVQTAVTETLQSAPEGVTVSQDLTFLDDGSPAAWTVEYTAADGANLSGKLPQNLASEDISASMGLRTVAGDPMVAISGDDAPDTALDALAIATEYLPETETLTYSASPEGTTLDIVLSPGVDIDLIGADLAERLPDGTAVTVAALDVFPEPGTERINQATLIRERFQFENWLPVLSFAPVEEICRDQSALALEGTGINFLTGSAQLDAKSIRAINALAAIAQRCVDEGNLILEVGGHTDTVGAAFDNLVLSEDRADAVRSALVERGVDRMKIRAVGYGQDVPIADNETEEGRAANRRTEITWDQQ